MIVKANIAYKYRLYPNDEQEILCKKSIGCSRFMYNRLVEDKLSHTPAHYKHDFPWLSEVDSTIFANAWKHVKQAFSNHKKNPKQFGYPQFKSKRCSRKSFSSNCINGNIKVTAKSLKLPKFKCPIKMIVHRDLPDPKTHRLKSVTVSCDADGKWFASLLYEYDLKVPELPVSLMKDTAIGFDYKSNGFIVDSTGKTYGSNKHYRKAKRKLARLQRRLSRKKKHSKNHEKARKALARQHCKIKRRRLDDLHKLSKQLSEEHHFICVEDLNLKAMANKGFGNGKATLDNSYGKFLELLDYKLYRSGGRLIKVDKWFPSSQLCSHCGFQNKAVKDLNVHKWICPVCGTCHDRDINAAINIKTEGLRLFLNDLKQAV